MNRSRFKNRYLKWPSREKFMADKKLKNLRNSLNKKAKKSYLEKAAENGIMGSKMLGVQSNLSFHQKTSFIILTTIEIDNKIIENKSELAKTFNSDYINIVKSTTSKHPTKLGTLASRISQKKSLQLSLTNSKIIRAL